MPSPSGMLSRQRSAQKPTTHFDPKAFLANAGIGRTLRHYQPKQIIFSQGVRADAVFYIQEGTVRLNVVSKYGKEATIALLGAGDFLGQGCIASDQPIHMTTATATTSCSVLKIEKKEMLRVLHEEHRFSDMFVAYVVGRHNRTQSDLVDQL
ncbi:MAG: cyclic nucleotide-binding domain-containing protein, partial [Candidatus Acidiferrales bacterium]